MASDQSTSAFPDPRLQRLQRLLEANRLIVAELSLDGVLARLVETARDLIGAQAAAVSLVSPDQETRASAHVGLDNLVAAALLGSDGQLVEHPGVTGILVVPISPDGDSSGQLFLVNPSGPGGFSAADETLARSLADTAAVAVTNAKLYGSALQRQEWLRISSEVSQRLLTDEDDDAAMLADLAASALRVAGADGVIITLPVPGAPGTLEIAATSGDGLDPLRGIRFEGEGSLAWTAMQGDQPLVVRDLQDGFENAWNLPLPGQVSHVMVFPLLGKDTARGAITVGRVSDTPFTTSDLELVEAFAIQTALGLEMADARADQQRIALLEERARIARNLQDNVLQRLFAAGLTIQSAAGKTEDPTLRAQLASTVGNLDETIRSLRSSIFDLNQPETAPGPFPTRMLAVVVELTAVLGFTPALQLEGPVESVVDSELVAEVEAALREALTEVAHHSGATSASVQFEVDQHALTLTVSDNGFIPVPSRPRRGLDRLQQRAEARDGSLAVDDLPDGGLDLRWSVPLG